MKQLACYNGWLEVDFSFCQTLLYYCSRVVCKIKLRERSDSLHLGVAHCTGFLAAITNQPSKTGREGMLFQFSRAEVLLGLGAETRVQAGLVPSGGSQGECDSLPSPASRRCLHSLSCGPFPSLGGQQHCIFRLLLLSHFFLSPEKSHPLLRIDVLPWSVWLSG